MKPEIRGHDCGLPNGRPGYQIGGSLNLIPMSWSHGKCDVERAGVRALSQTQDTRSNKCDLG